MRILLVNDDGILAPGLQAMRKELQKLGDVTVVAPATEQSAAGHSITLMNPLLVNEVFDTDNQRLGWAVEGRPADCVKLALTELMQGPPDIVVSGINAGSNAGINVIYSGTVAAAIEGAFFDITSFAVSLEYTQPVHLNFPRAAELGRGIIEQTLAQKPPHPSLFNINIPSLDRGAPLGVKVVPQGLLRYRESYDRRTDPRGRVYFWIAPDLHCPPHAEDTDVCSMAAQYITVTPLKFDLTHVGMLERMRKWEWRV